MVSHYNSPVEATVFRDRHYSSISLRCSGPVVRSNTLQQPCVVRWRRRGVSNRLLPYLTRPSHNFKLRVHGTRCEPLGTSRDTKGFIRHWIR